MRIFWASNPGFWRDTIAVKETRLPNPAIIVFARAPEPGVVKTRLIPALGDEGACRLYRALLEHTLEQARSSGYQDLQLWLTGRGGVSTRARGEGGADSPGDVWQRRRQSTGDLGRRMAHAVCDNFARGRRAVIVVGSDCPQLQGDHYRRVAAALMEVDAVLIPALDGGYVLLGLRRYHPRLFRDIPWGGAEVLATTECRMIELGWSYRCLEPLADIDRPEDLKFLAGLPDSAFISAMDSESEADG